MRTVNSQEERETESPDTECAYGMCRTMPEDDYWSLRPNDVFRLLVVEAEARSLRLLEILRFYRIGVISIATPPEGRRILVIVESELTAILSIATRVLVFTSSPPSV